MCVSTLNLKPKHTKLSSLAHTAFAFSHELPQVWGGQALVPLGQAWSAVIAPTIIGLEEGLQVKTSTQPVAQLILTTHVHSHVSPCIHVHCDSLGLLLGLEAPVMTPNGVNFLFFSFLFFKVFFSPPFLTFSFLFFTLILCLACCPPQEDPEEARQDDQHRADG